MQHPVTGPEYPMQDPVTGPEYPIDNSSRQALQKGE
jgi:hypothetical protein